LLEIGAGAGRMTHRLAELYGRVIALDVSDKMLQLGRGNLAGVGKVEWVVGSGADLDVVPACSVDDVFSYITLEHVPSAAAVLRYLEEAGRVLRPGGKPRCRCAIRARCRGRSTWPVTLCTPPRAAGCGRQSGAGPAFRRAGCCSRPRRGQGPASSCDRVAIGTCGCCCGADAAAKANPTASLDDRFQGQWS
jgi:methyltransferase family protein